MYNATQHSPARAQSWSTADEDIRAWVDGIVDALRSDMREELVAVYLHGSLAMGCYYQPKSDLDLLVVVRSSLAPDVRERLTRLLLRSHDGRPTTGGLEVSVVTEAAAKRFSHPMPFEVHFSSSWTDCVRRDDVDYDAARTDPDLAAHVMVTRERGVALVGPPAKRVFGAVRWRDYIASIKDDFDWIVDDDNLLTTPFYGVLNAARVCMVLEKGEGCVPSKDEAGEWALKQFPASHQDIVRQALACYRDGGPVKDADRQVHGHAWDGAQLRSFRDYVTGRALDGLLNAEERGLEGSPWGQEVVREARSAVDARGPEALLVDDLTEGDLEDIPWSGSSTHIDHVRRALQRVPSGEVEYLAVRTPSRAPIAKGGIDYVEHPDGGTLWQLATHPDLQGLGIGTRLISAAEDRIRRRGRPYAYLGVEDGNAPARRLYERLGYKEVGREPDSWDQEDEHGDVYRYETEVVILRKELETGDL